MKISSNPTFESSNKEKESSKKLPEVPKMNKKATETVIKLTEESS